MNSLTLAMAGPFDDPEGSAREVEAALAGDAAAFEAVMRRHERLVLVTALRLLGSLEDAQDASQEVFLRLHRNLNKLDCPAAMRAWLYRVTVNVCHDLRARRRVSVPIEDAGPLTAVGPNPQQALSEAERRRALALSLRSLPEKQRAALVLRDLEGLSTGEVARALGSSEAAVRSNICHARVRIKSFVEQYFRRRL